MVEIQFHVFYSVFVNCYQEVEVPLADLRFSEGGSSDEEYDPLNDVSIMICISCLHAIEIINIKHEVCCQ